MKNYISRLLSVLAIAGFLILPAALFASTPQIIDEYYPYNRNTNTSTAVNPQNYGQTHSYNVLLRGNGEIVSWATVSITNGNASPVSQMTFKTGNMSPRLFEVWQESAGSGYKYEKLTVQSSGKTQTVTLSKQISQNQTGTIIINYRGFGAVKKGLFGKMKFDFQTLESNDRIRSARVVAEADVDLYIKGDKAKVSYVESAPSSFGKVAGGGMAMENALSSGLSDRSLSSGIGGYYPTNSTNSITKSTTDLLAGDVFHVRGMYASSWLGMYWTGFAWFIFIIAAIIAAIVLARKYWSRIMPPKTPSNNTPEQKSEQPVSANSSLPFWRTIWGAMVMGFLNAVATIFLVFLVPFGTNSLIGSMNYGYGDDFMRIGLTLLFALISFILFVGTIFGPSIYFGIRYGKQYGFIVFGAQIASLIFLAFFGFYFFAIMARNIF